MHRHPRWRRALVLLAAVLVGVPAAPATAQTLAPSAPAVTPPPIPGLPGLAPTAPEPSAEDVAAAEKLERREEVRRVAVRAARSRIGSPYQWGGNGPSSFDCSGLTRWAMRRADIKLPRTSQQQQNAGYAIADSDIKPGDMVFFDTAGPGASHVGIAVSSTAAISATSSGVRRHAIKTGYWGSHFIDARRVRL